VQFQFGHGVDVGKYAPTCLEVAGERFGFTFTGAILATRAAQGPSMWGCSDDSGTTPDPDCMFSVAQGALSSSGVPIRDLRAGPRLHARRLDVSEEACSTARMLM
jgi:hypothetical protein